MNSLIAVFEFTAFLLIVTDFLIYSWNRSAPGNRSVKTVNLIQSVDTQSNLKAKQIAENSTYGLIVLSEADQKFKAEYNTERTQFAALQEIAKQLGVKNIHSYKKIASLERAIARAKGKDIG